MPLCPPRYGVHSFLMVNEEGKETFVKFHWLTNQGLRWLDDEVGGGKREREGCGLAFPNTNLRFARFTSSGFASCLDWQRKS